MGIRSRSTRLMIAIGVLITIGACSWIPSKKPQAQSAPSRDRLKLVWISLDGLQPEALDPWVRQMKSPHPKGLTWLLHQARGDSAVKVASPTITAPSHISTLTCVGPGEHGIMDNTMWSGTEMVSGFGRAYQPENWVTALRNQGLRVGVAMYPSIDGTAGERKADVGSFYDNPGSAPQMIQVTAQAPVSQVAVPSRSPGTEPYQVTLRRDADGHVFADTPWGSTGALKSAQPADVYFAARFDGVERKAGLSFMLVSSDASGATVEVSPVQVMPAYDESLQKEVDRENLIFSALRDYRLQSNTKAFLATMNHRHSALMKLDHMLLERQDLDAVMLYFEDLDALLHAYYRDAEREADVVSYLEIFDQHLGELIDKVPATADLLVVGDHGMSAIGYVLNSRKILGPDVAAKGMLAGGGGSLYFYPPAGALSQDPPAGLDLDALAETLRQATFEVTNQKIFGKVLVRGSQEAAAEGLAGKNLPWIMAFANDGIAFKNSVEDKLLLARAKWAEIPEALREKYPDPMNSGQLQVPVPAGQHGHWNELSQMRTRLVMEGPRLGKIAPGAVGSMLSVVPVVADAEQWVRPRGCQAR